MYVHCIASFILMQVLSSGNGERKCWKVVKLTGVKSCGLHVVYIGSYTYTGWLSFLTSRPMWYTCTCMAVCSQGSCGSLIKLCTCTTALCDFQTDSCSLLFRFLCSRSGRVYLHKDIRLIFASRAPDTEPDFSRVTLVTVMEAPPSPKYGPLDSQLDKTRLVDGGM